MPTIAAAAPPEVKSTTDRLRPLPVPPWLRAGFRVTSALAPGAAALLARRLFFTPPRAPVRAEERAVFFAPPARFDTFWARFRAGVGVPDGVLRRMVRGSEEWLEVSFAEIAPADLAPRMTAPLLVLHDAGDREMPFAEGAELARRWPGAALRRSEGLGHLRILREKASLDAAVRFLAGDTC